MYHEEFAPPTELQDAIKCFWYNRKDFGEHQTGFEVVPDGYAEIIFYFGSPCSVVNNGALQPLPSPFMMGLLNQPFVFYTKDIFEIIAVRCYPWTVFDLLGLQPGKDGLRTFKHPIAQLQPILGTLVKAGKIKEAVAQVEQYFLHARQQPADDNTLFKAGAAMTEAGGTIPVKQVAAAANATVRTLERKFKQAAGHTVKDVSALMRFEQVRNQLWGNPNINLAGLALELGYADQSHLSREFKRYSGTTPAAFARKTRQRQQAVSSDFVAFVQA